MPIFNERGEVVEAVDIDSLNENFTVTDDDTSGENEQEVATPASEPEEDEGANQDLADPEEDESVSAEAVPEADDGTDKAAQSKAENRRQAALRREREAAEAKTAAQDEVIKGMNLVNPATGKTVETYADYLAMKSQSAQEKIREQLKAQGVDVGLVDKLIEEHPVVKEARAAIETANAKETRADETLDNAKFEKLLSDVKSVIPEIKTSSDLFKWKHFDKFSILVNGGVSPLEAAETLAGDSKAKAARQAAFNDMASKAHLIRTKTTSSSGDYGISDAEYAAFIEFNPGKTREEAAAAYKKHRKG